MCLRVRSSFVGEGFGDEVAGGSLDTPRGS